MKKAMFLAMFLFSSVALGQSRLGFDGCYQLYMPSTMYPAFCLQGTAEEGIGGSGVRLVIFRTNTDRIAKCALSSGSGMTRESFTFEMDGRVELELKNVRTISGRNEGDAIFGRTALKFMEINDRDTNRLFQVANDGCDW